MNTANLLFLHAQTSLHPGAGTALGAIDLPVARERHTQWPLIPASSLKGVLRDACRREIARIGGDGPPDSARLKRADRDPTLMAVFGWTRGEEKVDGAEQEADAKKEKEREYAGALSLTDARILAFPVRSLRGVFAWVTCPAVLERLGRDLKLANQTAALDPQTVEAIRHALPPAPAPARETEARSKALAGPVVTLEGESANSAPVIILEEHDFEVLNREETARAALAGKIAEWVTADPPTQQSITDRLIVLADDDFTHFVRHATEVVARIALDYETKTVKGKMLFYQEFLPAETLMYALLLAEPSRDGNGRESRTPSMDAGAVLKFVRDKQLDVLQLGGDETTGKGYCFATIWPRPAAQGGNQ